MGMFSEQPFDPQTYGKIERWHETMKNRVLPENYRSDGSVWAIGEWSTKPCSIVQVGDGGCALPQPTLTRH